MTLQADRQAPLVSIVMAARDTESFIEKCLQSIIAQTYQNWELIAVNDHSIDRTPEIIADYSQVDSRIKLIHSQRQKLIPALKEGYWYSQGQLLNRMDSDDYMPSDKLETLVSLWTRYGRGHVIAGGTKHFVSNGEVGNGFRKYDRWLNEVARKNTHYQEIYRECVIPSHCWMIHRDDFEKVGGFEPEVYPEDYDLCFRFYEAKLKIIGIDKILHFWRDRPSRISRTWDCYQDNRYFDLKARYFYKLDRNYARPLVVWGGGRNGKDLVKTIFKEEKKICWVCDNLKKIGKDIYDIRMKHFSHILELSRPQILIAVASPNDRDGITQQLHLWDKKPVEDYWFFS